VRIDPDSSLLVMPAPPEAAACRALETIEARSALVQHLAAPPEEAMRLGLHAERYGSATAILMRKSKNLMYSRLIAWGQASTGTPEQLDRFVALAHTHLAEAVGVPLGPCARPARLRDWLEKRGFESGNPGAKLWRNAAPLPKRTTGHGITVRIARRKDAATWVDVVAQVWRAFGSRRAWFEARARAPGWRHYLAWIDGEPVAAGALFVGTVGERTVGTCADRASSSRICASRGNCNCGDGDTATPAHYFARNTRHPSVARSGSRALAVTQGGHPRGATHPQ